MVIVIYPSQEGEGEYKIMNEETDFTANLWSMKILPKTCQTLVSKERERERNGRKSADEDFQLVNLLISCEWERVRERKKRAIKVSLSHLLYIPSSWMAYHHHHWVAFNRYSFTKVINYYASERERESEKRCLMVENYFYSRERENFTQHVVLLFPSAE